jgi:hypothetical protein
MVFVRNVQESFTLIALKMIKKLNGRENRADLFLLFFENVGISRMSR